jgi:putative acetyltransferase
VAIKTIELTIREFARDDALAFRRLNEEWITRYFVLEPKDSYVLNDPQRTIVDRGGKILVAVREGEVVGCCALLAMGPGEFEVAKMAITESSQGIGAGRLLLQQVIAAAQASGATRLYLETNKKLTVAIRLYQSLGFRHLPPERLTPSAYARADVFMELHLPQT